MVEYILRKYIYLREDEMTDINLIKAAIRELYEKRSDIHVDVHCTKPKIHVVGAPATITGVYKNLFTLEVTDNGLKKVYTVQYTDLFIGKVSINELKNAF